MSVQSVSSNSAFQARSLFRSLLRQANQFSAYNFREYARRRTIDAFREHQHETEERKIQELMQKGLANLQMMKRQTVISQFYQLDRLVVEGQKTGKETGDHGSIVRQNDSGCESRSFGRRIHQRKRQKQDGPRKCSYTSTNTLRYRPVIPVTAVLAGGWRQNPWRVKPNRSSRSHRSGPVDHDVFEGLPVRRWARQLTTVSQEPKSTEEETSIVDSQSLPELPMPRDSNLLTPVSRALLRAARAGCTYIRPVRKDPEPEELEQKDDDDTVVEPTVDERTFAAMKWTALPRTVELPEVEFLAPRRAGLPSLYGAGAQSNAATAAGSSTPMRKTKFKKIDPTTGVISIYEAWVPEGYQVEGEIIQEAQVIAENPDAKVVNVEPAPGTVVADIGVVNQDGVVVATAEGSAVIPKVNKGKRKLKAGKAKSRKKVMFASGDGNGQQEAPGAEGPANPSVSENGGAIPSGTVSVPEDEEEDEEEGDESEEEDETATDSKPTPTADGPVDENNMTPAGDVPSEPQDIPQQPPTVEKESLEPTPSEPPQTISKSPDLPILTNSTSEQPSKSPTEEPPLAPASTEPSNEAVPPIEAQQADPETVEQPKISAPPVSAAEDAKAASPVAPLPENLDNKMDTAEDETHHQPAPEKTASPPAPAKEEQVSLPTIPPSTTEAESKPQTPDAHTSNPLSETIPVSTPTTGPGEPAAEEPAGPSSSPPPPETTADSKPEPTSSGPVRFEDGEVDLLGSLEASLGKDPDATVQDKREETSETAATTIEKKEDDTDTKPEASPAKEEENKEDDKDKDVEMTG
ncbi:hypothetical protein A7C99_2674 [Trichophyton rubrum]|uniref:Complex 1 LYR protein domain-containing protein n=1 Tax=Trichophyton rubrum TaxID=5551 RepID=A0A178F293_TRIRU|nr:hypothetical protein A7C99_2674 [Trichophyton rubrum]